MHRCLLCDGQLALMGQLGQAVYSRCEQCGADHRAKVHEGPQPVTVPAMGTLERVQYEVDKADAKRMTDEEYTRQWNCPSRVCLD